MWFYLRMSDDDNLFQKFPSMFHFIFISLRIYITINCNKSTVYNARKTMCTNGSFWELKVAIWEIRYIICCIRLYKPGISNFLKPHLDYFPFLEGFSFPSKELMQHCKRQRRYNLIFYTIEVGVISNLSLIKNISQRRIR